MAEYQVLIKPSAAKEIDRLPLHVASRVVAKIEALGAAPRPDGVKKLEGEPVRWRIRIGDWRVIYTIDDARRLVDVIYVRDRKSVV